MAEWVNLDYPHLAEGWAFPSPKGRSHYFRDGRSFCGRHRIAPETRIAGRLDEATEDPCRSCERTALAEVARLWCEHGDPPGECSDCLLVCPHGDPTCPCPDGDMCHYEGPDPMAEPTGLDRVLRPGTTKESL